MKKKKILVVAAIAIALGGSILWAADHIDAPAVTGQATDITDVYAFQGATATSRVFVINTQGLLTPGSSGTTSMAKFDANTLIQLNIDNNNDNVEDLVIQAIYDGTNIKFYGPIKPTVTGLKSQLEGPVTATVAVTPYSASAPTTATGSNGMQVFAGPRDDPFFFDLDQFHKIIAGTATAFRSPGVDAFAGSNVMSVVMEVPVSLLNATGGKINVWAVTKKKI
ncbi:MAG TPA: DUF4331 family protein [Chitinophagaceae bacterium]|jgi:Domain of unknown function (DUF4331)|nr:DUF4331 family protein [Chitinophagaceae bacterium]